ncbi:hypothetical protein [Methylobacterium nigriterrae]|uniref:hypothetical protein n=1 Tax=Methylobacterium nigriterrae TaxID=3127512 RepID=UPI0030141898
MFYFLLLMTACGMVAGLCLTWLFLSLVGLFVVPFAVTAMVWSGQGVLPAVAQVCLGFVLLQVGFVVTGLGSELVRGRARRVGQYEGKYQGKYEKDATRREI